MKTVGRKTYISWGDKVVAVEIIAETPESFCQRTGILVSNDSSIVCEIVDIMGQRTERVVGPILKEPTYDNIQNLGSFLANNKMISSNDIKSMCEQSNTPLRLQSIEEADLADCYVLDMKGFQGFIEMPTNPLLMNYNIFNHIAFNNKDNKSFVPVFVFEDNEFEFDITNDNELKTHHWIVLFYGTDNASYGSRFLTKEDAMQFVSKGYMCAFDETNKLHFYNS